MILCLLQILVIITVMPYSPVRCTPYVMTGVDGLDGALYRSTTSSDEILCRVVKVVIGQNRHFRLRVMVRKNDYFGFTEAIGVGAPFDGGRANVYVHSENGDWTEHACQ